MVILTKEDMTTRNGYRYNLNEWLQAESIRPLELCSRGCLHLYATPAVAAFMAPFYGVDDHTRCFEAEARGLAVTNWTIIGVQEARPMREIVRPHPTSEQRSMFSALCAAATPEPFNIAAYPKDIAKYIRAAKHSWPDNADPHISSAQVAYYVSTRDKVDIVPLAEQAYWGSIVIKD